jgi:hypothetical protein
MTPVPFPGAPSPVPARASPAGVEGGPATFIDLIIVTSFALLASSVILAATGGGPRNS